MQTGFFNISSKANSSVEEKRRRKGLGPLLPREKNVYGQILLFGAAMGVSQTATAPLERARIVMQTLHHQNMKSADKPKPTFSGILANQGLQNMWRGNMANIYRGWTQLSLKIFLFDKFLYFKFWRLASSASICTAASFLVSYPLDLIHTRISSDLNKKGQQRLFKTTFDCFNRTNVDEGRRGLFKGVEFALAFAVVRGIFTLPIYEMLRSSSHVQSSEGDGKQSLVKTFMQRLGPAMISSLILSTILYPLDTMKRCAQVNGGKGQLLLYRTPMEVYPKIMQIQGVAGLYRGVHLFALHELLTAFVYVSAYEAFSPHSFGIE